MAVELLTLVESLKRAVNPPGGDLYPDAGEAEWVGRLADAFWDARLNGFFAGYFEQGGAVSPETGTTDLPRDLQQVIVTYAAYRSTRQRLLNLTSSSRYKAGPVESEVQRSAQLLAALLKDLAAELQRLRHEIAVSRRTYGGVAFLDLVAVRDHQLLSGDGWWLR